MSGSKQPNLGISSCRLGTVVQECLCSINVKPLSKSASIVPNARSGGLCGGRRWPLRDRQIVASDRSTSLVRLVSIVRFKRPLIVSTGDELHNSIMGENDLINTHLIFEIIIVSHRKRYL